MHNPFKTPTYEYDRPPASTLHIKILLILLSVITTFMLAKDFSHLLSIHGNSLVNGANISIFHYIYLKAASLEIAYFRISSSIAMLTLIFFTGRNSQIFQKNYLLIIAYGVTQLTYQVLSVTGVIGILSSVAGVSALNISFWLNSAMASNMTQLLARFIIIIFPPLAYLVLCTITKSKLTKNRTHGPAHISN